MHGRLSKISIQRECAPIRLLRNIIRLDEALAKVGSVLTPRCSTELLPLAHAAGRFAGEPVLASWPVPHFRRSTMDGFAVVARVTTGASEALPALLSLARPDAQGCLAVLTGAPISPPYDAVVMQEYAEQVHSDTIMVTRPVAPGENVMDVGEDVEEGTTLVAAGQCLSPSSIAVLATQGITSVRVKSFKVGIIATGDEVVPLERVPQAGQIRDCNSPYLTSLFASRGLTPVYLGIIRDDEAWLAEALARGLAECDALVLSGGSSAGVLDFTTKAILRLPSAEVLVHGLAVKPGKPTVLAIASGKLVVGLPGHPLSCAVIAHKVAWPLLCQAAGFVPPAEWESIALLSRAVSSVPGRRDFIPVSLEHGVAAPLSAKSAAIQVLSLAQGLLTLPEECEGLSAGARIAVEIWR